MNSVVFPKTAILEVTYDCNHHCKFCSCPWENTENKHLCFEKREELSIGDWKKALRILEDIGVERVGISGGEPVLKEGLADLLQYIRNNTQLNKDRKITLISNGFAISESWLSVFRETGVHLSLSLPGLATFAYHTGSETNTAAKVLRWLKRAKEEGLSTTANITVTRRNFHELYETIANALIAGADTILLNRFLFGGRGVAYKDELSLSKDEIREMVDVAEKVLATAGRAGSVGTEVPFCLIPEDRQKDSRLRVGSLCAAAKPNGFFVIDPSGYIRTCNHSPKRLGYIFDEELIKENDYWQCFANRDFGLPEMCAGCEHVSRCDCGCREAANICYGSVSAPDPCMGLVNEARYGNGTKIL